MKNDCDPGDFGEGGALKGDELNLNFKFKERSLETVLLSLRQTFWKFLEKVPKNVSWNKDLGGKFRKNFLLSYWHLAGPRGGEGEG